MLNKSLFDAYPGQEDMTGSQYRRVKNILTSLALWTAIVYQTVDAAPSVAGVRDASGAVFATPSAFAETSSATVLAPVATPVQVEAASVSVVSMLGAIVFKEIADNMPNDTPPDEPPSITINPGDEGPAGGVLALKLEVADYWIETAPHDIKGSFMMLNGEAENECKKYSVTVDGTKIGGWYLPGKEELLAIYALYKEGEIKTDSSFESHPYWSSTPYNADCYVSVNFRNGRADGVNSDFYSQLYTYVDKQKYTLIT